MRGDLGALLGSDAFATFLPAPPQPPDPRARITASPATSPRWRSHLPGRTERVVRGEERAETGEHEDGAETSRSADCRPPINGLQRTARGLREAGTLVVVRTRPQHRHAEAAERDGPDDDVAEPRVRASRNSSSVPATMRPIATGRRRSPRRRVEPVAPASAAARRRDRA